MKPNNSKTRMKPGRPPAFPPLTKAQKEWISARRRELQALIDDGIASGKAHGYRAFEADRVLAFVAQRRQMKAKPRKSRARQHLAFSYLRWPN